MCVVRPGGNRLLRIQFATATAQDQTCERLVELGCHWEGARQGYVAVSVPPHVDLGVVVDVIVDVIEEAGQHWERANPAPEA